MLRNMKSHARRKNVSLTSCTYLNSRLAMPWPKLCTWIFGFFSRNAATAIGTA